ncbi:MAG: exonuclease domain-containing protein, partial [Candidatus Limnocylindria bacterium]
MDLETTGFDPDADRIVEIGAARLVRGPSGDLSVSDRFVTFVDPGRALGPAVARLTGIRPEDLLRAPALPEAMRGLSDFLAGDATLLGHNVGFDAAFLERAGLTAGLARLDTAELASIVLPTASSYALQRLAADEAILPEAAHRALHDALTCAGVLNALARRARALPPLVLEECRQQASLLGPAYVEFFEQALLGSWGAGGGTPIKGGESATAAPAAAGDAASGDRARRGVEGPRPHDVTGRAVVAGRPTPERAATEPRQDPRSLGAAADAFAALADTLPGYEDRPEQREMAEAVERTFEEGGVLVAEAGTGIGKSLAYLVPALERARRGERTIVSTYTLPLQEQLVRKDFPALQAALGTDVPVAILKGRSHYLCPRRWQVFRSAAATRDEVRLALKTLVWRTTTQTGDRAELNLMGGESALWPRISADDESCDGARCSRVAGGCYLQRARERASNAGVVVVNHALLLYDARMRSSLLPAAEHAVVDEAHHIEDVAADVFGYRLEEQRVWRDLDRVARSPLVIAALRDDRVELAEAVRAEVERCWAAADETFGLLAAVLPTGASDEKLRVTSALRA